MKRTCSTIALMLASCGFTAAATLDLGGDYGSPEGCKYLKDPAQWQEAVSVLTPTQYKDFVTSCEFLQVLPAGDGSRVVTMLCQQELDVQTIDVVRVVKAENADAYLIFNAAGGRLAELAACEPKR